MITSDGPPTKTSSMKSRFTGLPCQSRKEGAGLLLFRLNVGAIGLNPRDLRTNKAA